METRNLLIALLCLCLSPAIFAVNGDLGASKGADGSEAMPWLIEDFDDFDAFCGDNSKWASGVYTRLETDIDLDPALPGRVVYIMTPIAPAKFSTHSIGGPPFEGHFDGNNHVIFHFTFNSPIPWFFHGFFGALTDTATVQNLTLENINFSNAEMVGGLVGLNYGDIINCNVTGTIHNAGIAGGLVAFNQGSIDNCHFTGDVDGYFDVGGLVGSDRISPTYDFVSNSISNSSTTGTVTYVEKVSYETTAPAIESLVYGISNRIGGLAGNVTNCDLSNCYSNCTVSYFGNENNIAIGGLVGLIDDSNVLNCYSIGAVNSNEGYIGGLIGLSGQREDFIIINSFSACQISSAYFQKIGGLIGSAYHPYGDTIFNCFWDTEISGVANGLGSYQVGHDFDNTIGLTTANMQDVDTFLGAGWDFVGEDGNGSEDLWRMPYVEPGYPILAWERDIPGDIAGGYGVNLEDFVELSSGWMDEYEFADLEELAGYWLEQ